MSIIFLSMIILSLIMSLNSTSAASTPNYVGVEENDTFIWNTEFKAEPMEDYLKELYYNLGFNKIYNILDDYIGVWEA